MCIELANSNISTPIMARELNDKIVFFGKKIFTLSKNSNSKYLMSWIKFIKYDLVEDSKGLTLVSELNEQEANVNYTIELNGKFYNKQKAIKISKLGMHFIIEECVSNLLDIKLFINNAASSIKYFSTSYASGINLELPVFTFDDFIQVFGQDNNAIAKMLIIPVPDIFNKYLHNIDDENINLINEITKDYIKIYDYLKKLGNITCA